MDNQSLGSYYLLLLIYCLLCAPISNNLYTFKLNHEYVVIQNGCICAFKPLKKYQN